jgi:dTMP kinase
LGLFIVFEGCEGCGKSTQARTLYRRLCSQEIPVVLTFEPGGTVLGNRIRKILKNRGSTLICPETELFLFVASRIQLITEIICPALQRGDVVVCDRFSPSTLAYQGYGRHLPISTVQLINNLSVKNIEPDINILLDIPPEEGLARRLDCRDSFESMDLQFHHRVREGYLKMASVDPARWEVIDASLPRKQITNIIWDKIEALLKNSKYSLQ